MAPKTYVPALDGIRALAVCAVVAYHLPLPVLHGGLLGVSVFFTLSGYLITSLLLQERRRRNSIDLAAFWRRRARRLLPAQLAMLTVVGVATAIAEPDRIRATARQITWALLYVSNWTTIASGDDYFRRVSGPGPLDHLWSLAVEEQFYLVWPLLVAAMLRLGAQVGRRRLPLLLLTGLLTAASTACIWLSYDPSAMNNTRAYEGTDTRAAALLVGALAALLAPFEQGASAVPRRVSLTGVLGFMGLLGIASSVVYVDEQSSFLYRGGELLLSVCGAFVAIAATHRHTAVAHILSVAPLRWLGARSYGLYLWHLPIIAFMPRDTLVHHPAFLAAAAVVCLLLLASASYRWLEEPIRRRLGVPRLALALRAAVGVVLASVGLLVMPLLLTVRLEPAALAAERRVEAALLSEPTSEEVAATTPSVTVPGMPSGASQGEAAKGLLTSCREMIHIGDSTSVGLISKGVLPHAEDRIGARYQAVGVERFIPEISGARSMVETFEDRPNATQVAKKYRKSNFKGCWVLALGTNDPANTSGNVEMLSARIATMMAIVGEDPVIWTTTKTRLDKGPYRNANMEKWNQAIGEACARYPHLRVYDWATEVKDEWFSKDGIHFNSDGCKERAARFAKAVALAFPKEGPAPSGCMVRTSSN